MPRLRYTGETWPYAPEGPVEYVDNDRGDEVETYRTYREIGQITTRVPASDYGNGVLDVHTVIYVDTQTGVLVADVPAYEKWRANA